MKPLTISELNTLPDGTKLWSVEHGFACEVHKNVTLDFEMSEKYFITKEAAEEQLRFDALLNKLGVEPESTPMYGYAIPGDLNRHSVKLQVGNIVNSNGKRYLVTKSGTTK